MTKKALMAKFRRLVKAINDCSKQWEARYKYFTHTNEYDIHLIRKEDGAEVWVYLYLDWKDAEQALVYINGVLQKALEGVPFGIYKCTHIDKYTLAAPIGGFSELTVNVLAREDE